MNGHRNTLADQLKRLQTSPPPSIDPDSAYAHLDGLDIPPRHGEEGREHYLDVGPSRLRGKGDVQALIGERYGGVTRGRMKIFDDEDEEEDEVEGRTGEGSGSGEDEEFDEDEGDDSEDNTDGRDEDGDEEEDEDQVDEEGEEERGEEQSEEENRPKDRSTARKPSHGVEGAVDPVASLRNARQKDIEKGRAIKRQKQLLDNLLTLRITFQKAVTASERMGYPLLTDPAGEVEEQRRAALFTLADLSDKLFELRTEMALPGTEIPAGLGKRKRAEDDDVHSEEYWTTAANDSLSLVDASRPELIAILNKWSSKIQAATAQVGSKQAGGSKFLQGTKGSGGGVMEAIESALSSKRESDIPYFESEEAGYRALLREVIEARSGSAAGADLSHLRREKKKKREAERGGSKGRKIRYTIHEKAQNFVVPIPLSHGWHDEQVDELFSSLFGGVGMKGGRAESVGGVGPAEGEIASLGGLRVL